MLEPHHDRIALIANDSGAATTYRELEARSNQCAHYLRGLGIRGSDDVVAVLLDNDVHYYDLLVGVRRSGATFTALNYDLDPDSLSHILALSRAKVLVATDTMAALAARIVNATSAAPPHCLVVGSSDPIPPVPNGFQPYDEVIGAASTDPLRDPSIGGFLNFTSGSSGMPKPIITAGAACLRSRPFPPGRCRRWSGINTVSTWSPAPFITRCRDWSVRWCTRAAARSCCFAISHPNMCSRPSSATESLIR